MVKWKERQMTKYNWNEVCEIKEKLEEYCSLECDSHGEAVRALCDLSQYPDYITQELWDSVVIAMKHELKNYVDNARIIITPTTYVCDVAELEWNAQ